MSEIESVQGYFANLNDHFLAEHAAGVSFTYQFKISGDGGGDWYVVVNDGALEVNEGVHDSPDTTYEVSAEHYLKIITGKMNGRMAVLTRKMKVNGSIPAAMKMNKFMPPAS